MQGRFPSSRLLRRLTLVLGLALSGCGDCGGPATDPDAGIPGDASSKLDAAGETDSAMSTDAAVETDAADPDAATLSDATAPADALAEDSASGDARQGDAAIGSDAAGADDASISCADTALTMDTAGSGPWLAVGSVSGDRFEGTCSAGYPGEDTLLRFVAPRAGTYRFSTEGSSFDTILYLRSDCASPASQRACNDQIGLSSQAQVELTLIDQQEIFIVIDSYRDSSDKSFVLRVHDAQSLPVPELGSLQAFCNQAPNALGLLASGSAPFDDVGFLELQLLDSEGSPTLMHGQPELEIAVESSPFVEFGVTGSAFTLQFSAPMETPLDGVARVSVRLATRSGDYGPARVVACVAPTPLGAGAECDPQGGLNRCSDGQRCSSEAGPAAPARCVDATAPSLSSAGAAYNSSARSLGVSVEGQDLEHNAWYARVVLLDGELLPLRRDPLDNQSPLLDPIYIELRLDWVNASFAGWGSRLLPRSIPPGAHFEAVRIHIVDRSGLESAGLDAVTRAPLALLSGDPCDLAQAFGSCPGAEVCGYDDGNVGSQTFCQIVEPTCPAEWPVVALDSMPAGTGTWLHAGSLAETTNYGGSASCGGGGPQVVARFLAPEAGTYLFELSASGSDPLLFARSHCTLPQPEFELACLDDVDLLRGELSAENRLQLQAGEQIYLFADGSIAPGSAGLAGHYEMKATFEGSTP